MDLRIDSKNFIQIDNCGDTIRVREGKEKSYEEADTLGEQHMIQELGVLVRLKKSCYENEKNKGGY